MKPNPFHDDLPDVAANLKIVANILMNAYRIIKMKETPKYKDQFIGNMIFGSCSEEEAQQVYAANDYAETMVGYAGDIIAYFTDVAEYVDAMDVQRDANYCAIESFVKDWCIPSSGLSDNEYKFFEAFHICSTIPEEAVQVLRSLKYEEFLKTKYWRSVSRYLRSMRKCELCGSPENLQIHHKTYEHHGQEHLYLEDLQCLCKDCHLKVHHELNKKK